MRATRENEEIARTIINIFAEKNSTVENAIQVLRYVEDTIKTNTTVQKVNKKLFKSEN